MLQLSCYRSGSFRQDRVASAKSGGRRPLPVSSWSSQHDLPEDRHLKLGLKLECPESLEILWDFGDFLACSNLLWFFGSFGHPIWILKFTNVRWMWSSQSGTNVAGLQGSQGALLPVRQRGAIQSAIFVIGSLLRHHQAPSWCWNVLDMIQKPWFPSVFWRKCRFRCEVVQFLLSFRRKTPRKGQISRPSSAKVPSSFIVRRTLFLALAEP